MIFFITLNFLFLKSWKTVVNKKLPAYDYQLFIIQRVMCDTRKYNLTPQMKVKADGNLMVNDGVMISTEKMEFNNIKELLRY